MKYPGLALFACFFFLFRLWLCEIKLKDELGFRKNYLSRSISYFVIICWVFDLQSMIFNVMWMGVIPVLCVAAIMWDVRFYKEAFGKNTPPEWEEKKTWLVLERLTLHPPIIIPGLIPFFLGLRGYQDFILGSTLSSDIFGKTIAVIFGIILMISAFRFGDIRATDGSKTGKIIWVYHLAIILVMLPICLMA
jgi:hypothetical protein